MSINYEVVRWVQTGEPFEKNILNRPLEDLVLELENNLINTIKKHSADEAVVYAIALG